jgi:hypothetical protein
VQEVGAINPNATSITSINPDSEILPVTRSNGILTAHAVPEGGLISGTSVVMRMDGWTPEEMAVRTPAAMHLRWPEMRIDRDVRAPKSVEDQQKDIDKAQKTIAMPSPSRALTGTRAKHPQRTSRMICAGRR